MIKHAKRRPQIGEPGFAWAVGMWCLTRDGRCCEVIALSGIRNERPGWPVVVQAEETGACSVGLNGGRWTQITSRHDLIKVVAWPKATRQSPPDPVEDDGSQMSVFRLYEDGLLSAGVDLECRADDVMRQPLPPIKAAE